MNTPPFTFPLAADWRDDTVYLFSRPTRGEDRVTIQVVVDPALKTDKPEAYAQSVLAVMQSNMLGFSILDQYNYVAPQGLLGRLCLCQWNQSEGPSLYQCHAFLIHQGRAWRLLCSLNEFNWRHYGSEILRVMMSFSVLPTAGKK